MDTQIEGELCILVDGACEPFNPRGVPAFGFIIYRGCERLAKGSGLAAEPWTEKASNNVAEYTAFIGALEKAEALGLTFIPIRVRSDSSLYGR